MSGVDFSRRDGVAVITLSRPDSLNAVTTAMVEELLTILDGLATDTGTRVVVITGAGRAFTAGMDIQGGGLGDDRGAEAAEGRVQRIYRGMVRSGELVLRIREIPQPVVAALHGPVVGMGMSMALACDL